MSIGWWKLRVRLQDGLVEQAGSVAAAGWELWSQYDRAGPPADLGPAAALPDLQTLLQTGWVSLTAISNISCSTGSFILPVEQPALTCKVNKIGSISHTSMTSGLKWEKPWRNISVRFKPCVINHSSCDYNSNVFMLVFLRSCIHCEACRVSVGWDVWSLPVLWLSHAVGAVSWCPLLPRPAPLPTLQQQRPLPLTCYPHLPPHRVRKHCKNLSWTRKQIITGCKRKQAKWMRQYTTCTSFKWNFWWKIPVLFCFSTSFISESCI